MTKLCNRPTRMRAFAFAFAALAVASALVLFITVGGRARPDLELADALEKSAPAAPAYQQPFDGPTPPEVQAFAGTYWIVPQETLLAYTLSAGADPVPTTDQTIWYISAANQRYLQGWLWAFTSQLPSVGYLANPMQLFASLRPDGTAAFTFYSRTSSSNGARHCIPHA